MDIVVPLVIAVVALGLVAWQSVRARRKMRDLGEADRQHMRNARRRLRKSPVRYLSTVATAVLILATSIGTWTAWTVAVIVTVVALVLVDRNRRKILREEGFSLTWWGDPDYSKGTT